MPIATGEQALAADVKDIVRHFTDLAGGEDQSISNVSWTDWDISAIVPTGTAFVLIGLEWNSTNRGTFTIGVRKNGTALSRVVEVGGVAIDVYGTVSVVTEVDTNRVVEVYISSTAKVAKASVLGYWKGAV